MTDIVERLRSPANVFYEYAADNGAMLRESADEIERLREALSAMTELFKATEASAQWALSEVERLSKGLEIIRDNKYRELRLACECQVIAGAVLGEEE